jgi:endonuclease G, mitochondrial
MDLSGILDDRRLKGELRDLLSEEARVPGARARSIIGGAADGPVHRFIREHGPEPLQQVLAQAERDAHHLGDGLPEAVVKLFGRPVLLVQDDAVTEDVLDSLESGEWAKRLTEAKKRIDLVIPSVGRINLSNHPSYRWVGTGWVVQSRILVTNRHVAREFCRFRGAENRFIFQLHDQNRRSVGPRIDFKTEYERNEELDFRIVEVLHIEDDDGPDMAFLLLDDAAAGMQSIPLAGAPPGEGSHVAVIGYPAEDHRHNVLDAMRRIFDGIYEVKRLAPGKVMGAFPDFFTHDCTTLGGNSGSAVVDFARGEAVGLHYGGTPHTANFAIPAPLITDRLDKLRLA